MSALDPRELLERVLILERRQGYLDRAAVGGIERFVSAQLERAEPVALAALSAAMAVLRDYRQAEMTSREDAVRLALHVLRAETIGEIHPIHAQDAEAHSLSAPLHELPGAPSTGQLTPTTRKRTPALKPMPSIDAPLSQLPGVRKPTPDLLAKLGVSSVRDLLYYFPRAHYDFTDTSSISRMRVGQRTTLVGTIDHVRTNRTVRNVAITTAAVTDATGTVAVRWFNQPFIAKQLPIGARVAISGEPDIYNGFIVFNPKEYEVIEADDLTHTGRLVPVYPLTKGLFQRSLRKLIRTVVDAYSALIEDPLPSGVRERHDLPDLPEALRQYHFPGDEERRARAQRRLAFDELLLVQLGLLQRKHEWQHTVPDVAVVIDRNIAHAFESGLPFSLTGAQRRVIDEIFHDMALPVPMTRLLEGDVGSGKTVVAAAALLQTVRTGRQAVLMAPTEILAEQHFRTVETLLGPFGVRTALLVGSVKTKARRATYEAAASGGADVLVGTHALIQESLAFDRLGLAITDEQHRFGVGQRALLRQKGLNPHALAMTATPIPRTLAMTIYGDLDISVLDEMPPGRLPIITTWVSLPRDAYRVIREEIEKGRQAFVVCPVIEESAETDMRSVMAEYRELQSMVFPDLQVGLLHGKMKPAEKERILSAFRAGEFHVLVATSVVEVGIDIPNATAIVIRDAQRFGLAQLHQFRGRVGRGGDQAYCVLLSDTRADETIERLEALTETQNGFELAEIDLRLRGPGEFWGTRQSGLPELRVARLGDVATISLARQVAMEILAHDPQLEAAENLPLAQQVARFWREDADLN